MINYILNILLIVFIIVESYVLYKICEHICLEIHIFLKDLKREQKDLNERKRTLNLK